MAEASLSFKNIDQTHLLKVAVSTLRQVAEKNGIRDMTKLLNLQAAKLVVDKEQPSHLVAELVCPLVKGGLIASRVEELGKLAGLLASNDRGTISFSRVPITASDGTKFYLGDGDDNGAFVLNANKVHVWLWADADQQ